MYIDMYRKYFKCTIKGVNGAELIAMITLKCVQLAMNIIFQ